MIVECYVIPKTGFDFRTGQNQNFTFHNKIVARNGWGVDGVSQVTPMFIHMGFHAGSYAVPTSYPGNGNSAAATTFKTGILDEYPKFNLDTEFDLKNLFGTVEPTGT